MFFYVFSAFFVVMHLVLIFQKSFFLYWQITAYLSKCKIITALFILYFASSPFLTKPPSPNDPLTAPLMCGRSAIQNQTENNKRDGITSRPSGPQHHHHRRPNSVHIFFLGFPVTRYKITGLLHLISFNRFLSSQTNVPLCHPIPPRP